MEPTEQQKSYIAGFFDGEGCISFGYYKASKNGKRYGRLTIAIAQNTREVLDWIVSVTGLGSVSVQNTVEAAARQKHPKKLKRDVWQLKIRCGQAREFAKLIRPYLIVKAEDVDAKIAMDAVEVKGRKRLTDL